MDLKNYKRFSFKMAHDLWKTTCYYLVVPMMADGFIDVCNSFLIPRDKDELVKALAYLPFEKIDYYVAEIKEIYDGRRDSIAFVHERDVSYIVNGAFYYPLEECLDLGEKVKSYRLDYSKDIVVMELLEVFDEDDLLEIMHPFRYYSYRTLRNIKPMSIDTGLVNQTSGELMDKFHLCLQNAEDTTACEEVEWFLESIYWDGLTDLIDACMVNLLKSHGLVEKEVDENGNN